MARQRRGGRSAHHLRALSIARVAASGGAACRRGGRAGGLRTRGRGQRALVVCPQPRATPAAPCTFPVAGGPRRGGGFGRPRRGGRAGSLFPSRLVCGGGG